MLRSLFAGISGLRVNQTMLDVTGNNIANANTIGYKSSNTVFQDTLSQMLTGSTAANAARGGTNPIQIGLGVQLGATSGNFTQGQTQMTGANEDLMIAGDGFFVTQKNGENLYTRAGSFTFDNNNNLVTPSGSYVMGYALNPDGSPDRSALVRIKRDPAVGVPTPDPTAQILSYSFGSDGKLRAVMDDNSQIEIAQLALADFNNVKGLVKVGETSFRASGNSGAPQLGIVGEGRRGGVTAGAVEMSNVDLAAEFTNLILAQRGFQASSRVITTSDQVLEDLVNIKR